MVMTLLIAALENFREILRLSAISNRFVVSSSHYPMACSGSALNCVSIPIKLKQYWDNMFEHKVRLYFGDHNHSYQSIYPIYKNGSFSQYEQLQH
jgi:hypothetical protein